MNNEIKVENILVRLSKSTFRNRFHLTKKEIQYIQEKGLDKIEEHAKDFIKKRLAPAIILNDGKQTPMRGHPVFIAEHATATCCRGCLAKWHGISAGRDLTQSEFDYIIEVIMTWIKKEYE